MYVQQHDAFLALHKIIPRKDAEKWEAMSIEPVKGANGQWISPLMDPVGVGMQITSYQPLFSLVTDCA